MIDTKALDDAIKASGIKKKSLAKALGISPNALSKKLNGSREFKVSEIVKLKGILNLSDDDVKYIFLRPCVISNHTTETADD